VADFVSEVGDEKVKSLKKLERVKGIEPSSSAWKVVRKLNDINPHSPDDSLSCAALTPIQI